MTTGIENKVDKSGLITIDLGDYAPQTEVVVLDIKDWLYQGLILREQDFKEALKNHEWSQYQDKIVTVHCSNDAIIPVWAFMTLASKLKPYAQSVYFGSYEEALDQLFQANLDHLINPEDYEDAKIVIKGCGDVTITNGAFVYLTAKLQPYVTSIMYGEPRSTVPVYKKPKTRRQAKQGSTSTSSQ
jgi:S-adenosylmethionine/arginine decarboxylase-like enzyme